MAVSAVLSLRSTTPSPRSMTITLRSVLDGLVRMPNLGPEERAAAQEASRRYLDEIM